MTSTIERFDVVLIDGKHRGTVAQDGGSKSLVSTKAARLSDCDEQREWYDNDRLTVTARRREKLVGDESPDVKIY